MQQTDAVTIMGAYITPIARTDGRLRLIMALVVAAATAGCAAHKPTSIADRFVKQGEPTVDLGGPPPQATTAEYVSQLRALAAQAKPLTKASSMDVLEARDAGLRERLSALARTPSAVGHRDVAIEYRRLGIPDAAFRHVSAAIRLDPREASAYDLRAKLWRAWGLPGLGLADAKRAVALAPHSATAWNTLGLMFEGSGSTTLAVRAFLHAVQYDREAGYAWSNLCRTWTTTGEGHAAATACRRALAIQPDLMDAQLALFEAERLVESRSDARRAPERAVVTARPRAD